MDEHRIRVDQAPEEALDTLSEVAEIWGGAFAREGPGGRLELPVVAGLRRGVWRGRAELSGTSEGTWITLRPEEVHYRLNLPAVAVVTLGAGGALAATFWPFYPALLAVAPFAVVLALAAWFLVISRLRSGGVEEFLQLVEDYGPTPEEAASPPEPAPKGTRPR